MREMDEITRLSESDPVDADAVARASSHPVFDELFHYVVASAGSDFVEPDAARDSQLPGSTTHRWRRPLVVAAVLVAILLGTLAGVGVIGGSGNFGHPFSTGWKAAQPFVHSGAGGRGVRGGTWRLTDALFSGTWQQNDYGPPPGVFSCSPNGTCYVLYSAGSTTTSRGGTLYVSTDQGSTWATLPIPPGLEPTTPLECSGGQWCAMGATYKSQPAFAVTHNGGHTFTVDPLPTGVGTLRTLSCPSPGECLGLVSSSLHTEAPIDATVVVTRDGGASFSDEPALAGDSMIDLACATSTDCTAVGLTNASSHELVPTGVTAITSDGGRTWTAGSVPTGFDVKFSLLWCADAQHCSLAGFVPISNPTAAKCASTHTAPVRSSSLPAMSPAVAAISAHESKLKSTAAAEEAAQYHLSGGTCQPVTLVSDVAMSSDSGLTWTLDELPSDLPSPDLNGLSCPTSTECWAAGQEEVAQKVGRGINMGSPVLIGTTDGGAVWSKVVFSVPSTAPNAAGQSYLSIGSVTCPTKNLCMARGAAADTSLYAPVYSLTLPGS